jgi:hypothetical protein
LVLDKFLLNPQDPHAGERLGKPLTRLVLSFAKKYSTRPHPVQKKVGFWQHAGKDCRGGATT